jgi:tripartite-type tricarboxylate transporter receptor subunit TctC
MLISGGVAAAAVTPHAVVPHVKAVVPDFSYYSGKTITYIVNNGPGSTTYLDAQEAQGAIGQRLNATVNIEVISAGAGFVGENTAAAAAPDGLTLGADTIVADFYAQATGSPATNFNLENENLLFGTSGFNIIVGCSPDPIHFGTWTQMMNNKQPINALANANFSAGELHVIAAAYHEPWHIISSYPTAANVVQGCVRGDGSIAAGTVGQFAGAIAAGQMRVLGMWNNFPSTVVDASILKKQVTFLDPWFTKHPAKTAGERTAIKLMISCVGNSGVTTTVFMVPGTPAPYVAALQAVWKNIFAQKSVQAALVAIGGNPIYYTPAQAYGGGALRLHSHLVLYEVHQLPRLLTLPKKARPIGVSTELSWLRLSIGTRGRCRLTSVSATPASSDLRWSIDQDRAHRRVSTVATIRSSRSSGTQRSSDP